MQMIKHDINAVFKQILDMLTLQDYEDIIVSLGGVIKEKKQNKWILLTFCHNVEALDGSPKLEFYLNTKTFFCFSGCQTSYNIITLVQQRFKILGEEKNRVQCLKYIIEICSLNVNLDNFQMKEKPKDKCDWQSCVSRYNRYSSNYTENTIYDKSILDNLSNKYYQGWVDENISIDVQEKFGIKFYDFKQQICIPIYDDEANFIGVHCRNLNPEAIENGYKYMPFMDLAGNEYSFNTSNILYGLNMNKENIRYTKTAIIFEAPKSVLMYESISDVNNSVALFGMNMQKIKRDLLMKYECEHYIIALDRQYDKQYKDGVFCDENGNEIKVKTEEYAKYLKIINKIVKMLKPYGTVDVIIDNDENRKLEYKASPVDCSKEIWEYLLENRLKNVEKVE